MVNNVEHNVEKNSSIDTSKFISASEAGKLVGYTGDYISKLAREGKIDATRIGRAWVVTPKSVRAFASKSKVVKQIRGEEIRKERKQELREYKDQITSNLPTRKDVAILQTGVIALLGLSVGVSGYFAGVTAIHQQAATYVAELNIIEQFALQFYQFVSPQSKEVLVTKEVRGGPGGTDPTNPPGPASNAQNNYADNYSLIVGPSDQFTEADVASIRASFSDDVEVTVDADNPDTGLIVPIFRDHSGGEYRFLMVPNPTGR